jgi:predicted small lipoprotein YifL
MSKIIAVVLSFSLAACGMKTPLVMPARPAPEPLLGNPAPAKSTTKQPTASVPDVSTDTKTNISNPQ